MYHRHFKIIDSTQKFLKDNIDELIQHNELNLISCDFQTNGIGRTGNSWQFIDRSLAMSFSLNPNNNLSLTPLEIGILTCQFFKNRYDHQILLKWPNDLMSVNNKKVGGIITHYYNKQLILAGIGINIGEINFLKESIGENFRHGIESITLSSYNQNDLSLELYQFILHNRINENDILVEKYSELCCHINKKVLIDDGNIIHEGTFIGIDSNGAATILKDNIETNHISGSLTIY